MKRSLKKYDNGGKTKKPVFPGKLDNRVVSDNTSVQRPSIQKQDVRLKTPQEVKKANRENFQKRIGVKPTYNVQELTDFGTPEPGLEDASLEALDALSLASGVGYLGKKGLQVGAKNLANVLKPKPYSRLAFPKPVVSEYTPSLPNASSIDYNEVIRRNKNLKELWENPESNKLMAWDGTPLKLNHISENPDLINTLDNNKLKYQGLYFNPKKEWAFGKELGYSTQPWHKYTVEDAFSKNPYIADYHGQLQNLKPGANRIGDKLRKHISEGKDVTSFVDRERQLGISKIKNQTQSPEFKAYMSKLKKENPESFKNEVDRIRRNRNFKDLDFIENIYNKGYDSYVSYGGPKIDPSERGLEDAYEIVLFNKPTNLKKEFKKGGVINNLSTIQQFTPKVTAEQINRAAGMNVVTPTDQVIPQLESNVNSYELKDVSTKPASSNKTKLIPKYTSPAAKIASKPKFPVNLNTRMPSDNTSSYNIPVNPQRYEDKLMEFLDPTGITNYPDLLSAIGEKRYKDLPIEVLGSLPAIGKFKKPINLLSHLDDVNEIVQYPNGGIVNPLEADMISNVVMNRNRDKNFVNRAYAVGQNPGMFSVQDPENFGDVMSHKMAWGTDDAGQAYMYPTIMNPNNEAIKVPNQYAEYISSKGYKKATGMEYADGGTINNMKKRTLKKYQYSYGGLTVTDLNKYQNGGAKGAAGSATKTATSSGSGSPTPSPTGATVSGSAIGAGIGFGAEMVGALIPEKQYTDDEGTDLGSVKSIGESTLEYGAKGAAVTAALGGADFGIATALGAGYGAYKGWADKEEMQEKQKEANFKNSQRKLSSRMNNSVNFGNADVNTSTNMMFARGGMVLDYNDPNANAELELQETFQMPDGTVGNVDGPSHENGGIAVDLPEGTRIWSDKLKHNGKTFAKHTKPITNTIAKLEKQIEKNPVNSDAKENSIALLKNQLDYYFDTQESNKQNTEMKRTLREGGMIKRADGSYSKRGLWDNIRANKGSGKKPTPEMLKQERKINNEMAMGGYMYGQGGTNNPGFNALPEEVQENILAHMSMGGRLMDDHMYSEGGKLPQGVLQSRLEAHMSPEEADEYLSEYGKGGYTVRRSSDRKGKTHVVIGPDGTKKYFGDPNMGEKGNSKHGKDAFYARHKKNLDANPYFRAYARATWEEGGMMGEEYAEGGIHIKPENRGKFTAYAKSHGKGVQEMAAHIMANKEDYSPDVVKRANFAKNAAGWKHEMGGYLPMHEDGDIIGNPDRVAVGAINPKTGQPYTMEDVQVYTKSLGKLPKTFGTQYGGGQKHSFGKDSVYSTTYGDYEQNPVIPTSNPKINYAQSTLNPNNIPLKDRIKFTTPAMDSNFDMNQVPEELMYNTPQEVPYTTKPFNQLPIGINRPSKFELPKFNANPAQYVSPENLAMGDIGESTYKEPGFFNKAGQFIQNNPGLIGQLGTAALTAGTQMNRINNLARPRTLADVRLRDSVANPNLVDYSAERNAIDRAALTGMAEAQRGFGSSAAAQAFKNKARLNQLEGTGRSFQGQENANAQIRNQFLAARQEAAMKEAMMNNDISKYNLENVYGYDENKTRDLNAITGQLGNVASQTFGNISANKNQLKQLEMLARGNYKGVNRKTLIDLGIDDQTYETLTGQPAPKKYGGTIKRSFKIKKFNN